MKHARYIVWFATMNYDPESVEVTASNPNDALILAQAERIKAGCDYTLWKIERASGLGGNFETENEL